MVNEAVALVRHTAGKYFADAFRHKLCLDEVDDECLQLGYDESLKLLEQTQLAASQLSPVEYIEYTGKLAAERSRAICGLPQKQNEDV